MANSDNSVGMCLPHTYEHYTGRHVQAWNGALTSSVGHAGVVMWGELLESSPAFINGKGRNSLNYPRMKSSSCFKYRGRETWRTNQGRGPVTSAQPSERWCVAGPKAPLQGPARLCCTCPGLQGCDALPFPPRRPWDPLLEIVQPRK